MACYLAQVRQRFSIELGFRKTSKQRDIIKKEKCRTLREVKDKYNERVKWIEEACIDRIATAQSSLNRIEEDKRQAKERAAKTQVCRCNGCLLRPDSGRLVPTHLNLCDFVIRTTVYVRGVRIRGWK